MIDTIVLRFHGCLERKETLLDEVRAKHNDAPIYVVDEHHELYKRILKYKERFFYMVQRSIRETTSITAESEDDFLQAENAKRAVGFQYVKNVIRFVDDSYIRESIGATSGRWHSPSSLAAVVFKVNHNAGFIDFNLSIPKYLYGHSLAEFIPQAGSKRAFELGTLSLENISTQRKLIYKRLTEFIDRFLNDLAQMFKLDVLPNKQYIEVRRIDLTINQYFKNKEEALLYLEHQKKIAKKKSTHSNNKLDVYKTSLAYFTSSGGYFKIYHKGSEYISSKNGDYKKHKDYNKDFLDHYFKNNYDLKKIEHKLSDKDYVLSLFDEKIRGKELHYNPEEKKRINNTARVLKRLMPYKTDFLKAEMDKILRYEISLSGDFFAYQYKTHVFRNKPFKTKDDDGYYLEHAKCPHFDEMKQNHKYVHSIYYGTNKNLKKVKKFEHREYKEYDDFIKRKISLTLSDNHVHQWIMKSSGFTMKRVNGAKVTTMIPYDITMLRDKDVGLFDNDFLQRCYDYFFKVMDDFQLKKLETYDTIASRIAKHNDYVRNRVDVYNEYNAYKTKDVHGRPKIKGNIVVTKATQLLTQKEKMELGLKRIDPLRLMQIIREMERGYSLHQIRDLLKIEKSTFSRLKSDLAYFGVFEETLEMEKPIDVEISFRHYYHNTKGGEYMKKFYFKRDHFYEDAKQENRAFAHSSI